MSAHHGRDQIQDFTGLFNRRATSTEMISSGVTGILPPNPPPTSNG
jgi:hypothetical protein